jgi:hypothetical protein
MVIENYASMQRGIYKGLCIYYHNSNSGFNNGSRGATPYSIAQSSKTHAAQYMLPITEIHKLNEW